jgi:hypothetical protein
MRPTDKQMQQLLLRSQRLLKPQDTLPAGVFQQQVHAIEQVPLCEDPARRDLQRSVRHGGARPDSPPLAKTVCFVPCEFTSRLRDPETGNDEASYGSSKHQLIGALLSTTHKHM